MELVDSLDAIFQWQTPFSCTLLNDVKGSEGTIPSLEAMLVDIEFPEISSGPDQAAPAPGANPSSISLWPTDSVSVPLSPSPCSRTSAVATSAIQAPDGIRNPLAVNTKPCSVQTCITGFAVAAPTTPISCAPNTPTVVKPKGSRGSGTAKSKCTPKKKKRSPEEVGVGAAKPNSRESRVPTTAEHIIRERQRRDDMSAKYLILESLLPSAPKRERAVVVADAISYVGALKQKKAQLLSRRADLKVMAACNQSPWSKKTGPEYCKSDSPLSDSSDGFVVRADPTLVSGAGSISDIHVHAGEEEFLIEMVWNKPLPNFQSALLQAVQSLGLDVTQCSILRVGKHCIQCVVTCSKAPMDPLNLVLHVVAVTGPVAENIRGTIFFDLAHRGVEEYAHSELIQVQKTARASALTSVTDQASYEL